MSDANKSLFAKVGDYLRDGEIPDADKSVHALLAKMIKYEDGAAIKGVGVLMDGLVTNNSIHPRKMKQLFDIAKTVYESIYKMRILGHDSRKIASDTSDVVHKLFFIAMSQNVLFIHSSKRVEFAANVDDAIDCALDMIKLPAALKRGKLHNDVMSGRMLSRAGRALMAFITSIVTPNAASPTMPTNADVPAEA